MESFETQPIKKKKTLRHAEQDYHELCWQPEYMFRKRSNVVLYFYILRQL